MKSALYHILKMNSTFKILILIQNTHANGVTLFLLINFDKNKRLSIIFTVYHNSLRQYHQLLEHKIKIQGSVVKIEKSEGEWFTLHL